MKFMSCGKLSYFIVEKRVGIFDCVGFAFSRVFFLQLLHDLFTSKRSSDRQGHELDRLQRKTNRFVVSNIIAFHTGTSW